MNRFKYQAYLEEFPFLKEIIGEETPDNITIKRADENLLRIIPQYSYHDGSMGESRHEEKIHFVLNDGTIISDAVKQDGSETSNYAHSQSRYWEGETILEAIDRHGVADTLQYIVQDIYNLDDWSGQEYDCTWRIVLYKTPRDTNFREEISKAKAKALAEVKAETDF